MRYTSASTSSIYTDLIQVDLVHPDQGALPGRLRRAGGYSTPLLLLSEWSLHGDERGCKNPSSKGSPAGPVSLSKLCPCSSVPPEQGGSTLGPDSRPATCPRFLSLPRPKLQFSVRLLGMGTMRGERKSDDSIGPTAWLALRPHENRLYWENLVREYSLY